MSSLNPVHHDVDTGAITSSTNEYWIEPRASYTIQELAEFFYNKTGADRSVWFPKRVQGFLNSYIAEYGVDIVLFMIEHVGRLYHSEHIEFNFGSFRDNLPVARQYLNEIKNNCSYSGGDSYVLRKRVLSV